jgi:hypothetical protein
MWDKVECITEIKINGISLSLRAKSRGNEINISYKIDAGGFSLSGAVLMRSNFRFKIMRNMVMNNKFKYFGKITEKE